MPNTLQYAEKLSDRALGYGIYGETVDGDDPIAMYKAMKEAENALNGEGATLIEAITHRMTPHSSDDDDTYRTKEEREALKLMIVILSLKIIIRKEIINQEWLDNIEQEHKEIINKATKDAEKAPYPSVEETYQFVYDPEGGMQVNELY